MFKDIPGYEGRYAISTNGVIISLNRKTKFYLDGNIVEGNVIRKPYYDKNGYPRITLTSPRKSFGIHQLIMQTFVGPYPSDDHQINHKDWNKRNSSLENLEYITSLENNQYKNPSRVIPKGNTHWGYMKRGKLSKLSKRVGQYKDGILIKEYDSLGECARETGFNPSNIWCVIHKTRQKNCHGFTFEYL